MFPAPFISTPKTRTNKNERQNESEPVCVCVSVGEVFRCPIRRERVPFSFLWLFHVSFLTSAPPPPPQYPSTFTFSHSHSGDGLFIAAVSAERRQQWESRSRRTSPSAVATASSSSSSKQAGRVFPDAVALFLAEHIDGDGCCPPLKGTARPDCGCIKFTAIAKPPHHRAGG